MLDKPESRKLDASTDVRSKVYKSRYSRQSMSEYLRLAAHYEAVIGNRLQIIPEEICLDVACGVGNFLAFLRQLGVRDYVGVDNSDDQIRQATQEFGESHAVLGDAFSFLEQCEKASFNLISALDFVEHLTKVEYLRLLALVRDALAPGGMFLVRTPNADSPWGMSGRYNDLTHEICFTPNAFRDTALVVGFSRVKFWEDVPMLGEGLSYSVRWLGWKFAHLFLLSFAFLEVGRATDRVFSRNMWALAVKAE